MTTLVELMEARYTWSQIEAALLAGPANLFAVANIAGVTQADGCLRARAALADDLRRRLEQLPCGDNVPVTIWNPKQTAEQYRKLSRMGGWGER